MNPGDANNMHTTTLLSEADLRASVTLDLEAVDCVEQAFRALATTAVSMPPVLRLDIPEHHGEVDVKTAYIPGLDSFAIKVSPGFFDNPRHGLHVHGGRRWKIIPAGRRRGRRVGRNHRADSAHRHAAGRDG